MSVITIAAIISTGKYELSIMIPRKVKDGAVLTMLGILLSFCFSIFLLVFIAIFHNHIPGWLGNEHIDKWLYFVPLSTFLVGVFQCQSYWANRKKAYRSIASANLGQSIINSAVKLSSSKVLTQGGGLMTGAIVGQFAGALIYGYQMIRDGLEVFRSVQWKEMKSLAREYRFFPGYSMPHKLINNFSASLPVFVFSHYFNADIVGYFGLGFMLINRPMNLLSTSFTKVFSERIIAAHNRGALIYKDIRKFVLRMAAIAAAPFLIVLLVAPWLVTFIFGTDWYESGVYMRIFTPWLYMVFLAAPLSFVSDMLSRQRKDMLIETVKFILRIISLVAGVILNDVYLALMLFSGSSLLVVSYSLYWYLGLARRADEDKTLKNNYGKEQP
jgi:O-antigen/teichoic acid export membrane protein